MFYFYYENLFHNNKILSALLQTRQPCLIQMHPIHYDDRTSNNVQPGAELNSRNMDTLASPIQEVNHVVHPATDG